MKRLQPLSLDRVRLTRGFWKDRTEINRSSTLPAEYGHLKQTGRIDALRQTWRPGQPNPPHPFWDSDIAKWMEAAAYTLANKADPALERRIDRLVDLLADAQQDDGYLNTYFTVVKPDKRWTNLQVMHELYCAGHLIEAAVALHEVTGKRALLDVMCRCADHIDRVFGPDKTQKRGYPGHEEIELALVKLFRATAEQRYLDLACFFVNERGRQPHYFDREARARGEDPGPWEEGKYDYNQSHLPVREQKTAEGHAVRAMYLYCGMTDVAAETGDRALVSACKRLWRNVTQRRMYVTGGIGSARQGERFTFDYDLPNESAYAETCAAIGLVFWAHRMLQMDPNGTYADAMERALYNGVLSGVSQNGTRFFYENPLTVDPRASRYYGYTRGSGEVQRQPWFGCACCPTNLARLLASIGRYMVSQSGTQLWVHLYGGSRSTFVVREQQVMIEQETDYPWDGRIHLTVHAQAPVSFTLALRVPAWCRKPSLRINGRKIDIDAVTKRGYARLRRTWKPDDRIELRLPMRPERVEAHPSVRSDAGCVALQRGPLVYCLEESDNGPRLADLRLPASSPLRVRCGSRILGGVPIIEANAERRDVTAWGRALYRAAPGRKRAVRIRAIPYFLWANRKPGEMRVWIRS